MDAGGNRPAVSAAGEGDPEPNTIPDGGRPGLQDGDHSLVVAAQSGDQTAFEQLAQRHSVRLRRVLGRITCNPELAEDALQDALLRAWENLPRFQRRSSFLTWLTRIAINEAYRTMERSEAKATLPFNDAVGERIPAWGANPEAIFESREFLGAVESALGRLPLEYRQAVVLRDVEGFSTREAAEALGIEARALKSRLHRGRMALRRELDGFFEDDR